MRPFLWLAAVTVAAAVLFIAVPQIDLGIAGWLFRDGRFPLQDTAVAAAYRDLRDPASYAVLLLGLAGLLVGAVRGGDGPRRTAARLGFVVLAFGLGTGLVAETVLKPNWHRARPKDVSEFGGTLAFSPAVLLSDQCDRNCGFVSGDAAFAFNTGAFGLVARRRRAWWIGGSVALGLLVGAERVLQGAHFPSDVVFAGLFVWLVMLALLPVYRWTAGGRWAAGGARRPAARALDSPPSPA